MSEDLPSDMELIASLEKDLEKSLANVSRLQNEIAEAYEIINYINESVDEMLKSPASSARIWGEVLDSFLRDNGFRKF